MASVYDISFPNVALNADSESVFAPQERAQERQAKQNALAAARQQEMQANMLRNVVSQNIDPRTGRTNWQGAMSAAPQRLLPQLQGMMGESEKAAAELAAKQATTRNTEMEVDAKYWQNQRNLAALPHTQQSWSAWRETLPEWSREYVPEKFTPAAQQQVMRDSAAAIAEFNRQNLTAEQQSMAEDRGIGRTETERHNRAMEGIQSQTEARLSSNSEAPLAPKERQKREAAYPKATAALNGSITELDTQIKDLKILRDHPGLSGITGLIYGNTPALTADARAAKAKLKTILARGGFQELAKMRANSPTGGALGNVSDTEGRYLRDSYGSFDTSQDTEAFQLAIDNAITQAESSKLNLQQAYDDTYSYRQGAAPAGKPAGAPAVGTVEDGHRFKGGNPSDSKNWEPI